MLVARVALEGLLAVPVARDALLLAPDARAVALVSWGWSRGDRRVGAATNAANVRLMSSLTTSV